MKVQLFYGYNSGNAVTTGAYNTIVGSYTGNNAVLDIRAANNYAVFSDGGGTIKAYGDASNNWVVPSGNVVTSTAGKGITLKSPDGLTTKTLTIDNAGNIALI